jgi:hypothetical protein
MSAEAAFWQALSTAPLNTTFRSHPDRVFHRRARRRANGVALPLEHIFNTAVFLSSRPPGVRAVCTMGFCDVIRNCTKIFAAR